MSTRFVVKPGAIDGLLRSPEVEAELVRRAKAIEAAAGPGHIVDSQSGPNRARASVRTGTPEARRAEATSRDLSRAFTAGRG